MGLESHLPVWVGDWVGKRKQGLKRKKGAYCPLSVLIAILLAIQFPIVQPLPLQFHRMFLIVFSTYLGMVVIGVLLVPFPPLC